MMKQRPNSSRLKTQYKKWDKGSDSEEETDLLVLSPKKAPKPAIETVDKEIEEGDTLQSLAIRFHCTIEDLKRINNIHKENEIFARRTIKVPFRPFTAALAEVHSSGRNSPKENLSNTSKIDSKIDLLTVESKLRNSLLADVVQTDEVNDIIFNTNITQKTAQSTDLEDVNSLVDDDEQISLLPINHRKSDTTTVSWLNCSGADFGISWVVLMLCILIVILAVPLIYVLYIAEHPEKFHHQHV